MTANRAERRRTFRPGFFGMAEWGWAVWEGERKRIIYRIITILFMAMVLFDLLVMIVIPFEHL